MKSIEVQVKESLRRANEMYRRAYFVRVKESLKRAAQNYRLSNVEIVKIIKKKYNLAHRDVLQKASVSYRQHNLLKTKESSKHASATYKYKSPNKTKLLQHRHYLKRKQVESCSTNQCNLETNKHKRYEVQNDNCKTMVINISECIEQFNKNINVGPEHVCTYML